MSDYLGSKDTTELQLLSPLQLNGHVAAAATEIDYSDTCPRRSIKHHDIVSTQVAMGIPKLMDGTQSALCGTAMVFVGLANADCAAHNAAVQHATMVSKLPDIPTILHRITHNYATSVNIRQRSPLQRIKAVDVTRAVV